MIALLLFLLGLRVYYFNHFAVPDSDFFALQETAMQFRHMELPNNYQRPPLYSILIALLSLPIAGRGAMLFAAELINLISFLVSCGLLYAIAERLAGPRAAFATLFLYGLHPETMQMTVQPLAQMITITLVLLGVYWKQRGDGAPYLAAAMASVSRYEGAFLIPALYLKDFVFGTNRIRSTLCAGLASIPLLGWLALNYSTTGSVNPYFSYYSADNAAAGWEYLRVTVGTLVDFSLVPHFVPIKLLALVLFSFTMLGFYAMIRDSFVDFLPIGFYFLACSILNLSFFSATSSHVFLTLWVFLLAIAAGVRLAFNILRERSGALIGRLLCFGGGNVFTAVLGAGGMLSLLYVLSEKASPGVVVSGLLSFWIALVYLLVVMPRAVRVGAIAGVISVGAFALISAGNATAISKTMEAYSNSKGVFRLAGEWYSSHATRGERMVITEPWVAGFYADPDAMGNLLALQSFEARSNEEFLEELRKRDVSFVAWDSPVGKLDKQNFYFRKYRMDLITELAKGEDLAHFVLVQTLKFGRESVHIYRFTP